MDIEKEILDCSNAALQERNQQKADSFSCSALSIEDIKSLKEYLDMSKYMYQPSNTFKRVIKGNYENINHIHPIQQKRVEDIINTLKEFVEVKNITIFGSSTTYKCNYESDLDVYVELDKDINVKKYNIDCPVDFWTNFTVDSNMLKEINTNGVRVYHR